MKAIKASRLCNQLKCKIFPIQWDPRYNQVVSSQDDRYALRKILRNKLLDRFRFKKEN